MSVVTASSCTAAAADGRASPFLLPLVRDVVQQLRHGRVHDARCGVKAAVVRVRIARASSSGRRRHRHRCGCVWWLVRCSVNGNRYDVGNVVVVFVMFGGSRRRSRCWCSDLCALAVVASVLLRVHHPSVASTPADAVLSKNTKDRVTQ